MKLRRVALTNVRSFLERQELLLDGEISIIIGPNGGGKTNLLDTVVTVLRRHLIRSWTRRHVGNPQRPYLESFEPNDQVNNLRLERHSDARDKPQIIEVELEITQRDIENMASIRAAAAEFVQYCENRYTNSTIETAANWPEIPFNPGERVTFTIENDSLRTSDPRSHLFQQYLAIYEVDQRLRDELKREPLSTPMLSLPVTRAAGGFVSSVSLAGFNEFDHKKSVDIATSRSGGSLAGLAIGRIAAKYRVLLEEDSGHARKKFYKDPQIQALTKALNTLGYEWELEAVNVMNNSYDIRLRKQGSSFLVGDASSGEKELLTYLFAIYALNVRDALVIIDEPELHLHPRWQAALLELFETLSRDTQNQFLMATHSPVFVSPSSIQYVSRVYSDAQRSRIVRLNDAQLPNQKHLFSIINSQNNEKIFFTDLVILVEGISDRLIFGAALAECGLSIQAGEYEVVSVGGKGLFEAYKAVLSACRVNYAIVADLDYAANIGTQDIKELFSVSAAKIKAEVIDSPASADAASLVSRMDEAINTGNFEDLSQLWNYIKQRQRRLRVEMSDDDREKLAKFIKEKRSEGVFILSLGAIEKYLPVGYRSKDIEKLVELVGSGGLLGRLPEEGRPEISELLPLLVGRHSRGRVVEPDGEQQPSPIGQSPPLPTP